MRFTRFFLLGMLAVATVSVAHTSSAQAPPSRGYTLDERNPPDSARWKLVLGGLGTTAAFYALAQPFSYAWPDAPGSRDLRVPVAGPWIAIAHGGCPDDDPDCSKIWVVVRGILTALDGIGQAGGLGIALEGIFLPTADTVADRPVPPGSPKLRRKPKKPSDSPGDRPGEPKNIFLAPSPMHVGKHGIGLGVVGVF